MTPHSPVPSFTQKSPQPCKRLTNHNLAQNHDSSLISSQSVVHLNSAETSSITSEINQTQYPVQCECKFIIFPALSALICPFRNIFSKIVLDPFVQSGALSVQQEMRSTGDSFSHPQLSIGSLSRRADSPSGSGKSDQCLLLQLLVFKIGRFLDCLDHDFQFFSLIPFPHDTMASTH